jgi:Fe2+ transport system protein FeoA
MAADLDQAPLGVDLQVVAVRGPRAFRRRLLELGLLPGTVVRKQKVAPLGDPIELSVRGTRLSIRRAEARGIEVAP